MEHNLNLAVLQKKVWVRYLARNWYKIMSKGYICINLMINGNLSRTAVCTHLSLWPRFATGHRQTGMVDLPLSLTATGQRKMIQNTGGRTLTLGGVSNRQQAGAANCYFCCSRKFWASHPTRSGWWYVQLRRTVASNCKNPPRIKFEKFVKLTDHTCACRYSVYFAFIQSTFTDLSKDSNKKRD